MLLCSVGIVAVGVHFAEYEPAEDVIKEYEQMRRADNERVVWKYVPAPSRPMQFDAGRYATGISASR